MKLKFKSQDVLITASAVIFIFTMFKYVSEFAGFLTLSLIFLVTGLFVAWCKS